MSDAFFFISAPLILAGLVYLLSLVTFRFTKGALSGIALVGISLFFQWRHWETNHAPYVPLIMPSSEVLVLFPMTAVGIWIMAWVRTTGAWKWSLLGLVPVVGPLFAVFRLVTMPVVHPRKPSYWKCALTVVPGVMMCVMFGQLAPLGPFQEEAIEAPNGTSRVVVTSPRLMGHRYIHLDWQRLVGPFIVESRYIHGAADHNMDHYLGHYAMRSVFVRWSEDSSRVLVTDLHLSHDPSHTSRRTIHGRHFQIVHQLYVMYDVLDDRAWCNALNCKNLPQLTEEAVAHIPWVPAMDLRIKQCAANRPECVTGHT